MTVSELRRRLEGLGDDLEVFIVPPLPTETMDCELTGVYLGAGGSGVWLEWATENVGSGLDVTDMITITEEGLVWWGNRRAGH